MQLPPQTRSPKPSVTFIETITGKCHGCHFKKYSPPQKKENYDFVSYQKFVFAEL